MKNVKTSTFSRYLPKISYYLLIKKECSKKLFVNGMQMRKFSYTPCVLGTLSNITIIKHKRGSTLFNNI